MLVTPYRRACGVNTRPCRAWRLEDKAKATRHSLRCEARPLQSICGVGIEAAVQGL